MGCQHTPNSLSLSHTHTLTLHPLSQLSLTHTLDITPPIPTHSYTQTHWDYTLYPSSLLHTNTLTLHPRSQPSALLPGAHLMVSGLMGMSMSLDSQVPPPSSQMCPTSFACQTEPAKVRYCSKSYSQTIATRPFGCLCESSAKHMHTHKLERRKANSTWHYADKMRLQCVELPEKLYLFNYYTGKQYIYTKSEYSVCPSLTHTHTHTHACACASTQTHACMHTHMHTHTHAHRLIIISL